MVLGGVVAQFSGVLLCAAAVCCIVISEDEDGISGATVTLLLGSVEGGCVLGLVVGGSRQLSVRSTASVSPLSLQREHR